MSLSKKLVVIINTCEDLVIADTLNHSLKTVAVIIKQGLDEEDLKKLIEELKNA